MKYRIEIDPRPEELGGGWRLRLIEDGEEVGGGVYPPDEYDDALADGQAWMFDHLNADLQPL
ncbi:MAG: hypothetical protein QJR02_14260 [Sinobacteraceae bacterium]|nr:hypothetical protein [Nevskiaceae bacterium]